MAKNNLRKFKENTPSTSGDDFADDAPELRFGPGMIEDAGEEPSIDTATEAPCITTETDEANGRTFVRTKIVLDGSPEAEEAVRLHQQNFAELLRRSKDKGMGGPRHTVFY